MPKRIILKPHHKEMLMKHCILPERERAAKKEKLKNK
jgi:hypothetical protein